MSKACETCAFRDPEAWIADAAIGAKLMHSLRQGEAFFCHDDREVIDNKHQLPRLPDGQIDWSQMKVCAGFVAFYKSVRQLPAVAKDYSVLRLQEQMCRRFLAGDFPHVEQLKETCGNHPALLAEALNLRGLQLYDGDRCNPDHETAKRMLEEALA